ncbi:MAG: cytochrome c biogenesis protein ResB [Clostridiaceae bacterium]|nr:cytochrome c biogenesis protein ResB [Clostridiaceae bacterium]
MNQDSVFKDIWKALHSMKFGMILLLIISISSIAGTVIPQNNPLSFYKREYGSFTYTLISTLDLHKVYTSWWFIAMMVVLSINLTLCSVIRLPGLLRKMLHMPAVEKEMSRSDFLVREEIYGEIDVKKLFRKARFYRLKVQETEKGTFYFAYKHRFGHLGSWLTHVGLLIIIVSYMFGQITGFDTYIYGVPGVQEEIEHTSYMMSIDDFDIDFRPDYTVNQYTSSITIKNSVTEEIMKVGKTAVNEPFRMDNFSIYQNGTGWAVDMLLERDGEEIAERILYQSEIHVDDNQRIALQFSNFYPDFDNSRGMPRTISPYPNKPRFLYSVFYEGQRVDMNVAEMGQPIEWQEYTFIVTNPRQFTLLQIVSDPGIPGAKVGGLVLLHGIMFAFYFHPKQLKAFKDKEGRLTIWGDTIRNQEAYKLQIQQFLTNYDKKQGGNSDGAY